MSLAVSESTACEAGCSGLAAVRRAAYEDGHLLLPRLSDLGARLCCELPGAGGAVLVLSPDLRVEDRERVVSALFAKELGVVAERPLVIMRRDAGFQGPHLTWCPEGCITDHSNDVCRGTFLADVSHSIGTAAEMALAVWDGAVITKVRSHLVALEGLGERLVEARASYRGVRS